MVGDDRARVVQRRARRPRDDGADVDARHARLCSVPDDIANTPRREPASGLPPAATGIV